MTRLSIIALLVSATAASAQVCAPHAKLAEDLRKTHKETPFIVLVQANGSVLEIFANAKTQNWTIINTRTNGWSCIMGAGTGYVSGLAMPGVAS